MSITTNYANNTIEVESKPAMIDPPKAQSPAPHPMLNPCGGCPRQHGPNLICYGSIKINEETKQVHWRGMLMPFTKAETKVLAKLVLAQGVPVSYRALYDVVQRPGFIAGTSIRGICDGCNTNVRSMVKRIRAKFHRFDPAFNQIANYQGVGYSWSMD